MRQSAEVEALRNVLGIRKPIRGLAIGFVDGYTSAIVFGSVIVEESRYERRRGCAAAKAWSGGVMEWCGDENAEEDEERMGSSAAGFRVYASPFEFG